MCSNYRAVTRTDRMLTFFGVERGRDDPSTDIYPSHLSPCVIRAPADEAVPEFHLALVDAIFRLVPDFKAKVTWARHTFNARSETVATKPTYKRPWAKGQRCIIPVEWVYEPNYESGEHERWRIQKVGGVPMGIAGIYDVVEHPDGRQMYTMAMLTVNADHHPFMKRFHEPGEEKRMVAILEPEDYVAWLSCSVDQAAGFLKPWPGQLEGWHDPAPRRAPRSTSGQTIKPPRLDDPELF